MPVAPTTIATMLRRRRSFLVSIFLVVLGSRRVVGEVNEVEEDSSRILYYGSQLIRAFPETQTHVVALDQVEDVVGVELWSSGSRANNGTYDIMAPGHQVDVLLRYLGHHGIPFSVIIDDLQDAINNENPPSNQTEEDLQGRFGHRMTWQRYHRITDMHGFLDYMATTYSSMCSVTTIGNSVEGRPLKVIKISKGGSAKPAVWIDGGMHAREWVSPASVSYIIQQLVENKNYKSLLDSLDFYILPVANPDGYEHTHSRERLWRKNRARATSSGRCAGTDLNRNFGHQWGGAGASHEQCRETYAGPRAFSEPESRAISSFVQGQASRIKAYITFHSYGQYILYPWGYANKVPADHRDLQRVGQEAAQAMQRSGGGRYTVGNSATTLYPASGGSDDWAKSIGIKYTYTIELRDRGTYGFVLPASYILPTAKEALAAVEVIARAAAVA